MIKILLVEDDLSIIESLSEYLREEGFLIQSAPSREDAINYLRTYTFSLVLLDIALSDGNGYRVCSYAKEVNTPVIFLTASGDENSVVAGLEMGADDYIAKPFRPRELVARIKNVIQKKSNTLPVVITNTLLINTEEGRVYRLIHSDDSDEKDEIQLTALEYRLLLLFVHNRGRLLSREMLLADIWDIAGGYVNDNTLTVYIKRLREKIEPDPQNPTIIKTIRGLGYRMD